MDPILSAVLGCLLAAVLVAVLITVGAFWSSRKPPEPVDYAADYERRYRRENLYTGVFENPTMGPVEPDEPMGYPPFAPRRRAGSRTDLVLTFLVLAAAGLGIITRGVVGSGAMIAAAALVTVLVGVLLVRERGPRPTIVPALGPADFVELDRLAAAGLALDPEYESLVARAELGRRGDDQPIVRCGYVARQGTFRGRQCTKPGHGPGEAHDFTPVPEPEPVPEAPTAEVAPAAEVGEPAVIIGELEPDRIE